MKALRCPEGRSESFISFWPANMRSCLLCSTQAKLNILLQEPSGLTISCDDVALRCPEISFALLFRPSPTSHSTVGGSAGSTCRITRFTATNYHESYLNCNVLMIYSTSFRDSEKAAENGALSSTPQLARLAALTFFLPPPQTLLLTFFDMHSHSPSPLLPPRSPCPQRDLFWL